MNRKQMLQNAALITTVSLALRAAGMAYRVYTAGKVGAAGLGLYTLVQSAFSFAVTLSTAGISTAVTRLVSEDMARRVHNRRVLLVSMLYAVGLGCTAGTGLWFLADFVGETLLRDIRTALSLRILAPALPFMAAAACLKGYFYAQRRAWLPATADVVEQGVEIAVFASIVGSMAPRGIEYGCAAIVIGTTASELMSCAYLLLFYRLRRTRSRECERTGVLRRLTKIAVPVSATACLGSGLRTVENALIPAGLRRYGMDSDHALSQYGMVRGMALPLLFFPAALISAFSALMIPEISEARVKDGAVSMHGAICRVLQACLLLSILVTAVFMTFSEELGLLVYDSAEVGKLLLYLAPLIPMMYLDAVVDGMLKGLDRQLSVLRCNLVDSLIRVAMVLILVPVFGFHGFIVVMYISNILDPAVSLVMLLRVTGIGLKTADWVLKPTLCAALAGFTMKLFDRVGELGIYEYGWGVTLGITVMALLYIGLLFACSALEMRDVRWVGRILGSGKNGILS